MIRGVIFDLDGVLIHSTPIHDRAYRRVLEKVGITQFDYRNVAGMRTLDAMRILVGGDEARMRELAAEKTRLALEELRASNPLASGCRGMLQQLSARLPLALASSASRESVAVFLEVNSFGGMFRVVLTGHDVARAKPDPEIYVKTCAQLGFDPGDCVIVEDAVAGVTAGCGAGARVWGITGTTSREALIDAGAERVVDGLGELAGLIG